MDIRNILYKSIEQEVSSGTNFKLFSVDNKNAYTIRIYIDSGSDNFSLEVNNSVDKNNYKIENFKIGQNIDIYKIKTDSDDTSVDNYYIKFANSTSFTIRKEIVYGYLTNANTASDSTSLSDDNKIVSLTTSSPKHIFVGNSSFVGDTNISGDTNITGALTANNDVTVNGVATLGDASSDNIKFNANTTVKGTTTIDKDLTANGNVTIAGTTNLGDNASDQIRFNADTTVNGTANLASLTANGNVKITGTTKLGDNASDQINFNESTTVVGTTNLSGKINFNNFYINDFINTPEPGTEQPSGKSKIVFHDDSESVEIYGIYNEILKPIVIDNKYSGKVSVLISISNGTLATEAKGSELVLLRLETTENTPKITYSIIYKNNNISVYKDNVASTVIMDNGNYISNVLTLNFDNNAECKVISVYKKSDNNSITVYEVAQNIIGGGDSNANASHYLLTAQSLSQILTLSSLSAGATTTNLTKNPQGSINYDGTNQYLLYQSGTNTTELYSAEEDDEQRFIYLQNNQIKNRIGSNTSRADTLVIRDSNKNINTDSLTASKNINTGSLTASSVNAEGLNNAGKITVNGNASTGTLSITETLTSGATTVSGTSTLASLDARQKVTVSGTSNLDSFQSGATTVTGTSTINGNLSSGATTVSGTSNLASLIANGNVTVNGTSTLGDAASDNINFNATTTIKGTATLGDNASDQINFNAATTVKGTANFKSTLDANGGAVVTGKATLSSLTANGGVDVNGTTNLGDNASDQINFNAATTVKGTANFKSTLDANGGAVVTGKATLSSLTANGGVDVNGTTNLGDNASDAINFNSGTTINGTSTLASLIAQNTVTVKGNTFITGTINFGQVDQTDAASIFAENSSTVSGLIFSIADDDTDYISFRTKHWQNGSKDVLKLNFGSINAASNILPTSNNAISLGNNTLRWSGIYATSLNVSGSSILGTSQSDSITLNGILHFTGTTRNDYIRLYTEDIGNVGHKLVHHVHDSDSNAYYKFNFQNRAANASYDIIFPNDNGTIALTKNMDISATRDGAANDISVDQFGTITITINGKSVTISQNSADGSLDISANV